MPQPAYTDVHVDVPLTTISVAYRQSQEIFIASRVFPRVSVDFASNKYYTCPKQDWFRDEAQLRGDAEESAGGGMTLSTDNYSCDVWAFHKDLGHLTRGNADAQLNLERTAVQFVTQRLMLREEKQWVTDYFTGSIWGNDVTGVTSGPSAAQAIYWSDYAASNPLLDVEAQRTAILKRTGFLPNTLVVGYEVFAILKNHPDFIDRTKYTSDSVITQQLMARFFEVDNFYVAMAVQNTAQEGQTGAYSFVYGKHALLCYVNPNPRIEAPSAGYTFGWTGIDGNFIEGQGISSFYIPTKKATRYEGELAIDHKVVGSDLGTFFSGVVS
jgi:hypothetical protein